MPVLATSADRDAMSEFHVRKRAAAPRRSIIEVMPFLAHMTVRDAMSDSRVRYHSLDGVEGILDVPGGDAPSGGQPRATKATTTYAAWRSKFSRRRS